MLDHNSSARWSAFQIRKIAKVLNWQAGRTKYDRIKQLTTGRADCEAFLFYLPHYLWKAWEGNKISLMAKGMSSLGLTEHPSSKDEARETSGKNIDILDQ